MKKIMFNDRYVLTKAVLEGKKTQTRRVVKAPKRYKNKDVNGFYISEDIATQEVLGICMKDYDGSFIEEGDIYPKYKVGEIVAVAQSYSSIIEELNDPKNATCAEHYVWNQGLSRQCVGMIDHHGFRNKMFVCTDYMPHQIRITDVRVERLQDISDEDCLKEGIQYIDDIDKFYFERIDREEGFYFISPREFYADLIDKVSGKGTWESNPYVFVYDFELVK